MLSFENAFMTASPHHSPRDIPDVAKLIAASWRLSGQEATMPSSHGILDHVLFDLVMSEQLPVWVRDELDFAETPVGLRCAQLASILDEAQSRKLSAAPNPSYRVVQFTLSADVAKHLLSGLGVSLDEALRIGAALRNKVIETVDQFESTASLG